MCDEDRPRDPAVAGWELSGVLCLAKLSDAESVLEQVASGLEDYYLGAGARQGCGPAGSPPSSAWPAPSPPTTCGP